MLEEEKGNELTRICCEKLKKKDRVGRVESSWEEERRKFFKNREVKLEEVKRRRMEDKAWFSEVMKEDKEVQRKERWERINS